MSIEERKDRLALLVGIPLIIIGLIFIALMGQKDNKYRADNCIKSGGNPIYGEYGWFEKCYYKEQE